MKMARGLFTELPDREFVTYIVRGSNKEQRSTNFLISRENHHYESLQLGVSALSFLTAVPEPQRLGRPPG
jgi:hypothetical protein